MFAREICEAPYRTKAAPVKKLTLNSELHAVRLSDARDLWYDGSGAFETGTFGYLGRPRGGSRRVGKSIDLNVDYALSAKTSLLLYGGIMRGNAVSAFVFPAGSHRPVAHVLSIEIVRRF